MKLTAQPKNGLMVIRYTGISLDRSFETESKILVAAKAQPWKVAQVVDAGTGLISRDGTTNLPPPAKVGDYLITRDNAGDARQLGFLGKYPGYALIDPSEVLAVLEGFEEPRPMQMIDTGDLEGIDLNNPANYEVLP